MDDVVYSYYKKKYCSPRGRNVSDLVIAQHTGRLRQPRACRSSVRKVQLYVLVTKTTIIIKNFWTFFSFVAFSSMINSVIHNLIHTMSYRLIKNVNYNMIYNTICSMIYSMLNLHGNIFCLYNKFCFL